MLLPWVWDLPTVVINYGLTMVWPGHHGTGQEAEQPTTYSARLRLS